MGFVVICILFTQHLWTLMIAAATFLLLVRPCERRGLTLQKYPLSRVTVLLERYSWAIAPLIWGISLVHSGSMIFPREPTDNSQYGYTRSG